MDVGQVIESVVTSPATAPIAAGIAFVLGLVLRPFIEARTGLFKENASARRTFQRDSLLELQKVMESIDPRWQFEPLDYDPQVAISRSQRVALAERRVDILSTQIRDQPVLDAIMEWRTFEGPPDREEYEFTIDKVQKAVGNALRDL
jgi:hypothetical protein